MRNRIERSTGKKFLWVGLALILILLLCSCTPQPKGVVIYIPFTPTPSLASVPSTPTPDPDLCLIDWSWGHATLEVFQYAKHPRGEINTWKICAGLLEHGYQDYGINFQEYERDPTDELESLNCEFIWDIWSYKVWSLPDQPEWKAGEEFCDFLARIEGMEQICCIDY